MESTLDLIRNQASDCIEELLNYGSVPNQYAAVSSHNIPPLRAGQLVIVGCSTSRVTGRHMGTHSSEEIANAIMDSLLPIIGENGLYLACQSCEHLNRAIVVERACMDKYGFEEVSVKPRLHAGGAWSVCAWKRFDEPVMVENIMGMARAGMDVGGVFIGMHLHPVVVPVHAEHSKIGQAVVNMARVRPKYIGGGRAEY